MRYSVPTPVYRCLHLDNLNVYLSRKMLHSPNMTPNDGLTYKTIHDESIQQRRATTLIPCGPQGSLHDYLPFYFGRRSPMLYKLSKVQDQSDIIYIRCSVQEIVKAGISIVFSDGHGIMRVTKWYESLEDLKLLDWGTINSDIWNDTYEDPDRCRRKQAEFLVHRECPWSLVEKIGVMDSRTKGKVESILGQYDTKLAKEIVVVPNFYY